MNYVHVKSPKFVSLDGDGKVVSISCKLCGTVIAGHEERPVGYETDPQGNTIKVVRRQFVRYPIYTEIKMEMDDGGFHVTHGCSSCLSMSMPVEVLEELYQADVEEAPWGYGSEKKRPVRVVALKVGGEAVR